MSIKTLWKNWCDFFFTPIPTDGIALFRIIWFSLLFVSYLFDTGNIDNFYGANALISLETARSQFPALHVNVFHLIGVSDSAVTVMMTLWGIALIFALIGFYTRPAIISVIICMVSFHQRNIWLLSSAEVLMRIITIYLACSPCGHSLSVDAVLGRKFPLFNKEKSWSPWALRMIQIQISVVYLWTVWQKLQGKDWADGSALYYATRIDAMKNFSIPFLLDSLFLMKLLTWGTLLIEVALGVLLWFKETWRPVMIAGILFHLGIEYLMSIPFFELIMIVSILSFLPPEVVTNFAERCRQRLYDSIAQTPLAESKKNKILWVFQKQ